jgi:hypothetical protein
MIISAFKAQSADLWLRCWTAGCGFENGGLGVEPERDPSSMDSRERVSVIIVAQDKADGLINLVGSILPQLDQGDEVLIIVDPPVVGAPSNMTWEGAHEIARQVSIVSALANEGQGKNKGYETAIEACNNEVIFLAEPGDIWKPDKVAAALCALQASEVVLVVHDAELIAPRQNYRFYPSLFALFRKTDQPVVRRAWTGLVAKGWSENSTDVREGLVYLGFTKQQVRDAFAGSCIAFRKVLRQFALPFPEGVVLYDQWMGLVAERYGGVALTTRVLITKTVGDEGGTLSAAVSVKERFAEQRRLIKALRKRRRRLDLVLRRLDLELRQLDGQGRGNS